MKILVVMKNWLGDLLFQMPVLDLIKRKYPQASIICVAPERCREILEAHPAVSGFIPFDEKAEHRPLIPRMGFAFYLRKQGPWERAYLFHRSKTRAMLLALAGVKERIGYGKGRKFWLTQALPEPCASMHQLDYFLNFAKAAGLGEPEQSEYRFFYKDEDVKQAAAILKFEGIEPGTRYICFHLGANWEPKRWPPGHFAALADKIEARWHFPLLITGSQKDESLFREFKAKVYHAKVVSLAGKTSLRVSAAIYRNAVCLITGDSGPMHIASGVGAPVVALFGPTDPKLTGPRGSGKSKVLQHIPPGYKVPFPGKNLPAEGWLSHIGPNQVLEAIESISSH